MNNKNHYVNNTLESLNIIDKNIMSKNLKILYSDSFKKSHHLFDVIFLFCLLDNSLILRDATSISTGLTELHNFI